MDTKTVDSYYLKAYKGKRNFIDQESLTDMVNTIKDDDASSTFTGTVVKLIDEVTDVEASDMVFDMAKSISLNDLVDLIHVTTDIEPDYTVNGINNPDGSILLTYFENNDLASYYKVCGAIINSKVEFQKKLITLLKKQKQLFKESDSKTEKTGTKGIPKFKTVTIEELKTKSPKSMKSRIVKTLQYKEVDDKFMSALYKSIEFMYEEDFDNIMYIGITNGHYENIYDNLCELMGSQDLSVLDSKSLGILKSVYETDDLTELKQKRGDVSDVLAKINLLRGPQVHFGFAGALINNERCKKKIIESIQKGYL